MRVDVGIDNEVRELVVGSILRYLFNEENSSQFNQQGLNNYEHSICHFRKGEYPRL